MNFVGGQIVANAGVATIDDTDGSFAIKTQNPANVIIDVYGYWVPSLVQNGSSLGSVVIGQTPTSSGQYSVAAGYQATASGDYSTAMGYKSTASADSSTALGGATIASANGSTAAGIYTAALGIGSTAMGADSVASGDYSTVLGDGNKASGLGSTAIGLNSDTSFHVGSFVYGDGSSNGMGVTTANTADHQFMVRASGGFVIYTTAAIDTTVGVTLPAGGGAWTSLSDRNAKDAVLPINSSEVLDRVIAMPLATWHYKAQNPQYRHMGPMAQDFYSAFHLGESDTGIDTIDADGVALAAIQGLNAKLVDKDKEIEALKLRVASLESVAGDIAEMKRELAALRQARIPNGTVVAMTSEHAQ